MASDDNSGCGKVMAVIGAIAALVAIFIFVTGKASLPDLLGGQQSDQGHPVVVQPQQPVQVIEPTIVEPTLRPADTPLPTSRPTETPVPAPTPIPLPAGPVLDIGKTWKQNGVELWLKDASVDTDKIWTEWHLRNQTGQQILFQMSRDNFLARDNRGVTAQVEVWHACWGTTCRGGSHEGAFALEVDETLDFELNFYLKNVANPQVTEMIITVSDLSRINEAYWRVPIYH